MKIDSCDLMKNAISDKDKQMRKTLDDIVKYQNILRSIVKKKIIHNDVLSIEEKDEWDKICAYALFKFGNIVDAVFDFPHVTIPLGKVHTFALHFIDYEEKVEIRYNGKKYVFNIGDLWKKLYSYFDFVFPSSQEAGFYLSVEDQRTGEWEAYKFDVNRRI